MNITISKNDTIEEEEVLRLYRANKWSSADKPDQLLAGLRNSETLITARVEGVLVGIANAISDGHLVVYYPHMLVHPEKQGMGIGRKMMDAMQEKYGNFHQQMLTADCKTVGFYESLGFRLAKNTNSMWIYSGNDH
jgi:GNAT superfamily N-acetyltransferase